MDNSDSDENQPSYANILTRGETENPLNWLIAQDDTPINILDHHSLGGTWTAVLDQCNLNMASVAYFLKLSVSYTYHCFNQVLHVTQHQNHLPLNFPTGTPVSPRPWRRYRLYRIPEQLAFIFDEELPFT